MKGPVLRIAREEWRALARNRTGVIASLVLVALVVTAAVVSIEQRNALEAARARYQAMADEAFDAQPNRHPHRMVHYGQFVFRPTPALAFFDSGVNSYTGSTIFLEGHRQNSANFSDARQSSLLLRFGELTPAFVLQTLAPLLVIFLAFGAVARERERGTLRVLLAQGISGGQLVAGKVLGHGAVVLVIAAPAFLVLLGMTSIGLAPVAPSLLLLAGYAAYLLVWTLVSVLVSAVASRPRDALLALIGLWMIGVILLPRTLPEVAATRLQTPTRIETDIAIHSELKKIGDSHNPDDPYFNDFKARTLARYGVSRVEDLPVQYAGLVSMEGERLTSELYDRHAREAFGREQAQNRFVGVFGVVSPVIAVRQLSMALAGTDAASHQDFLDQAEHYRYRLVQALNRMQVEQIPNVDAGEDPRIDGSNWAKAPDFAYARPDPLRASADRIWTSLGLLAAWFCALAAVAVPVSRRLGRVAR
jgi:ABC-2 type transport system permease protein